MALFHVRMDVDIPRDLDPEVRAETLAREKKYSQDLQHSGKWVHIWRITGKFSNISIFDVETPDDLHEILWNLPLFPFMTIDVTPLNKHASSIK